MQPRPSLVTVSLLPSSILAEKGVEGGGWEGRTQSCHTRVLFPALPSAPLSTRPPTALSVCNQLSHSSISPSVYPPIRPF